MIKTISDSTVYHNQNGVFITPMGRYCPEVERAIRYARYIGIAIPTDYQLKMLSFYINGLRDIGTLNKKDLLYMFSYGSQHESDVVPIRANSTLWQANQFNILTNFSKINLINANNYYLSFPVETTNNVRRVTNTKNGIAKYAEAENSYLSTGFNLSTNATKYSLNDASFTWYFDGVNGNISNGSTGQAGLVNNSASDTSLRINPWTGTNGHTAGINGGLADFGAGVTTQAGFHICQRTASNALAWYKDNAAYGTRTTASTSIYNGELIFMIRYQATTSMIHVGSSYNSTERTQEYQLWNDYKTRLNIQ